MYLTLYKPVDNLRTRTQFSTMEKFTLVDKDNFKKMMEGKTLNMEPKKITPKETTERPLNNTPTPDENPEDPEVNPEELCEILDEFYKVTNERDLTKEGTTLGTFTLVKKDDFVDMVSLPLIKDDTSNIPLPEGMLRAQEDGSIFKLSKYGLDYFCPKHPTETIQIIRSAEEVTQIRNLDCFQCDIKENKIVTLP